MDIGCTKGMMSDHSLRGLVQKLKAGGMHKPVLSSSNSNTKYTFGDGLGQATKSIRKVQLLTVLNGEALSSESELATWAG